LDCPHWHRWRDAINAEQAMFWGGLDRCRVMVMFTVACMVVYEGGVERTEKACTEDHRGKRYLAAWGACGPNCASAGCLLFHWLW